jgi:hypothetical protein
MKYLLNGRRLAALGAVAAAVGVTLVVVLPALGSNSGEGILPASYYGVVPTDAPTGGSSTCTDFGYPPGTLEYDISTPKTTRTPIALGSGVGLSILMDPPVSGYNNPNSSLQDTQILKATWKKGDYFNFTLTGATILGVGVKGGNQSALYQYSPPGVIRGDANNFTDGYLHATAQAWTQGTIPEQTTQLYTVSQLTFCYLPSTHVAGTVYQDGNATTLANGIEDGSDAGIAGVTMRLYQNGSVVRTTTTDVNGHYRFDLPTGSGTYQVCEVKPPPTSPGHDWAASQPGPNSSGSFDCSGDPTQLSRGYNFDSSGVAVDNDNFGNANGILGACGSPFGIGGYQIKTAPGVCKSTIPFVFTQPNLPTPTLTVWADSTASPSPIVEKITFDDPLNSSGDPMYTGLQYNDTFPFTGTYAPLPFCKVDPRDPSDGTGFALAGAYSNAVNSGAVLPGAATSCAISITTIVDANGNTKLVAYAFTVVDGAMQPH